MRTLMNAHSMSRRCEHETPACRAVKHISWSVQWGMLLTCLAINGGVMTQAAQAAPAPQAVHFALIGSVPENPAQEVPVRALLSAIANQPEIDFILDDGNLKGPQETCSDTLLQDRQALLNSSLKPLIFVPGAHDWVDCQDLAAGRFDPLERLDFLRELLYTTSNSMGASSVPLAHESEVARFHNFHENTEWQQGPVLFVALNVAGNNNHFVDGGGRNGEFDDRTIANRFWLEHAARSARLRHCAAIVIAIEGDPGLGVQSQHGPFDWLDFRLASQRDGYQEFKQDLLKFAQQFDGPILLINQVHGHGLGDARGVPAAVPPVFRLTQPLRHKNGSPLGKIWQLELNTHSDPTHWVSVEIVPGREASFRASAHTVPANFSAQAPETGSNAVPASTASAPSSALPPVALPVPVLQIPGTTDSGSAVSPQPGS